MAAWTSDPPNASEPESAGSDFRRSAAEICPAQPGQQVYTEHLGAGSLQARSLSRPPAGGAGATESGASVTEKKPEDADIYRFGDAQWSAYTEHQTEVGVRFEEDHLLWWESPVFNPHSGAFGASEQSFEDFLARGPAYDGWLSAAALAELTAAVRARLAR